jgi:hypothetical protein
VTQVAVVDAEGNIVWTSPDLNEVVVERVGDLIRVIELESSRIVAVYHMRPGEQMTRMS